MIMIMPGPKKQSVTVTVCVFISCSTFYKAVRVGRGGSNDANPQDANLTLVGAIFFLWKYIYRSVLFGLFLISFE